MVCAANTERQRQRGKERERDCKHASKPLHVFGTMSDDKEGQEIPLATANGPAATAAVPAPSRELLDEERAVEIGAKTDCVKHLDALMFCYSPANQVSTYYQRGSVDDCQQMQSNLFKCLKIKMHRTAQEKENLLKEITGTEDFSPTADIWDFRENPSAVWRA